MTVLEAVGTRAESPIGAAVTLARSREPLRVVRELVDWVGHSPEKLSGMRAGVQRIGTGQIED